MGWVAGGCEKNQSIPCFAIKGEKSVKVNRKGSRFPLDICFFGDEYLIIPELRTNHNKEVYVWISSD